MDLEVDIDWVTILRELRAHFANKDNIIVQNIFDTVSRFALKIRELVRPDDEDLPWGSEAKKGEWINWSKAKVRDAVEIEVSVAEVRDSEKVKGWVEGRTLCLQLVARGRNDWFVNDEQVAEEALYRGIMPEESNGKEAEGVEEVLHDGKEPLETKDSVSTKFETLILRYYDRVLPGVQPPYPTIQINGSHAPTITLIREYVEETTQPKEYAIMPKVRINY